MVMVAVRNSNDFVAINNFNKIGLFHMIIRKQNYRINRSPPFLWASTYNYKAFQNPEYQEDTNINKPNLILLPL